VSFVSGEAFFRADQNSEWTPATLNYPVTEHNEFATNADARLELSIGSAAVDSMRTQRSASRASMTK
jgi:hypothetical protein